MQTTEQIINNLKVIEESVGRAIKDASLYVYEHYNRPTNKMKYVGFHLLWVHDTDHMTMFDYDFNPYLDVFEMAKVIGGVVREFECKAYITDKNGEYKLMEWVKIDA